MFDWMLSDKLYALFAPGISRWTSSPFWNGIPPKPAPMAKRLGAGRQGMDVTFGQHQHTIFGKISPNYIQLQAGSESDARRVSGPWLCSSNAVKVLRRTGSVAAWNGSVGLHRQDLSGHLALSRQVHGKLKEAEGTDRSPSD